MKLKKEKPTLTLKQKMQQTTVSAPVYITIVLAVSLVINLVAFWLFWNSQTRFLAQRIQQATEQTADKPFRLPVEGENINTEDEILTPTELYHIQQQIQKLSQKLDAQKDLPFIPKPTFLDDKDWQK